ncbi:gluconolactonase [Gammaproteobacteria bacterium]|nr:gluconolactonase [Gammaproteobacteria bacterium]
MQLPYTINKLNNDCAVLGEAPTWCEYYQCLWYLDILTQRLIAYTPLTKSSSFKQLPFLTSAILLTKIPNEAILVTDQGIYLYDLEKNQVLKNIGTTHCKHGLTRTNEAQIGADGALYFGTMALNPSNDDDDAQGAWYRFDGKQTILLADKVSIPNTLCWYKDHIYYADSRLKQMYYAPQDNFIQNKILFSIDPYSDTSLGTPDGSCVDSQGILINAQWGSGTLARYDLNQTAPLITLDKIDLPVLQPTSCCFGGDDLRTLFVTSANIDLDGDNDDYPLQYQGCLYAISGLGRGLTARRYETK